jgi:hypothetical protein
MRIVKIHDIPMEFRSSRGRDGKASTAVLMTGEDSRRPDNFSFRYIRFDEQRFSPRHRHNFAQYYYVLQGRSKVGDFELSEGWLGYMPEGVFYGPQTAGAHTMIVLQHGGPSGQGILGYDQHSQAYAEMKGQGRFEHGRYYSGSDSEDKKGKDSYEAIWEHVNGRPLVYPQAQYSGPVTMDTLAFPWKPTLGVEGVEVRHYGTFTDQSYGACGYRIARGANVRIAGRVMCLTLSGRGTAATDALEPLSAVYLEANEEIVFHATDELEILCLGLPQAFTQTVASAA